MAVFQPMNLTSPMVPITYVPLTFLVNPPVHAWATWRVYKESGASYEQRDRQFLARSFQKLMMNFTWWANRKDISGKHIFSGGFLGLE